MAITHRGLRHLRDQGLRIAQQQKLQLPISMELVLELLSDQAVSVTGALHDRPTGGRWKVNVAQDIAGLVQNLPERHRDEFQMRVESRLLRR